MARQSGFQQAFNVGELGPDAWSRSDLAQHSKGCILGYNMIGRVVGPTGRRPGTWMVSTIMDQAKKGRLIPFRRNSGDALVLEFGDNLARVWTVNGAPVMNGGSQVSFVTPWNTAALPGLRWRQVGDVMYFTSRDNISPQIVKRLSNTSWTVEGMGLFNGPFRNENTNAALTLTLAGTTLTSSQPFFQPGHFGALFRLRPSDGNPGVASWEPGETLTLGAARLSNGRVYSADAGGTTGNTPPVHAEGSVSDGGVAWSYLHDGAALVSVITYVSATQVEVALGSGVPEGLETGTKYWAESAYNGHRGWPSVAPVIREERVGLAGGPAEADAVNFTRTAGYTPQGLDFTPGLGTGRVVDDDAVRRLVGGDGDRIVWMAGSNFLIAGTTDGEHLITGATVDDPISPSGCTSRPLSEFGSADVLPALAYGGVMFVAAGGETLRRITVGFDQSIEGRDLSVIAEHIGRRGLAELTWLKQPWNLLWIQLGDGGQASFSYHAEQNVEGWNRHGLAALGLPSDEEPLGGGFALESSCVVPGYQGRPRLFMIVMREKDGAPQRLILRMSDPADKLFLDAAELYSGEAVGAVEGLDHLAGETCYMMAATVEGATAQPGRGWGGYAGRPVGDEGEAALPEGVTATIIQAGLPYRSRWEGLPPELAGPGSTAGRKVNYTHAAITLDAAVAWAGTTGDEGDSGRDRLLNRAPSDVAGPAVRRTTWRPVMLGGAGYERRYFVETDDGWDMVIHSVRPAAEVNG